MANVTVAQALLDQEQRQFPPPPDAGDRIGKIFAAIRPVLPPQLNALADRGDLVAGEIGEIHPDVSSAYPAVGYTVEFTTGMVLYTEIIAQYAGATFVEGAVGSPALALEDVTALLAAVMETYRKQSRALWKVFQPRFREHPVPVTQAAAEFRDTILECTRLFMISHELGHIAMAAGARPAVPPSEDEVAADRIGLEFALPSAAQMHGWRTAIAGAGLAIRLFVSLERSGVRFASVYPPQEQRLASLETAIRTQLGSDQAADECSTVMVALLDLMDDLDFRMGISPAKPKYTEMRARINVIARLIEVASGNLPADVFVAILAPFKVGLGDQTYERVMKTIDGYYWGWADTEGVFVTPEYIASQSAFSKPKLIAMSKALRAVR